MELGEMISMLIDQWKSYPRPAERLISAIGIDVHWTILQYVMGLPFMAFIAQLIYLKTRDSFWLGLARTLVKGFVIVFAVGAATGTTAEFGLILLWPKFLEVGGKFIFFPFYAEIYAFMMEVIFVYFLYYGWSRVGDKARLLLTALVFIGAWYSGAMIMAVNSYMVTPTGLEPAYNPDTGAMLYSQGYPKLELAIPANITSALDSVWLKENYVDMVGGGEEYAIAKVPAKLVYRLFWEASQNYTLSQSILWQGVKEEYREGLAQVSMQDVVDWILYQTTSVYDPLLYPLKSPSWPASVIHVTGASLAVSGYTVLGAYALRLLTGTASRERALRALRFAALYTLAVMLVQGFISGHEMGVEIAYYNPEKFAAMEGTSSQIISITRDLTGGLGEKLVAFLAYGSPDKPLPDYDSIPKDWCSFPGAPVVDCRPPLLIHYAYYTKMSLAIALGAYTLALAALLARGRTPGRSMLAAAALSPLVAHTVSFLGWLVREAGRKPFTVYGVFTPAEAGNPAGPNMLQLALVGIYLVAMLLILAWASYRFLWKTGGEG
ncbi:MAG: cytochrome ubiquinol oxidase subunit I [Desulfurococcales archaeon]|nr:cytochrome ubiquinol oxidase subunit I [Desulfurococcales archaeon]